MSLHPQASHPAAPLDLRSDIAARVAAPHRRPCRPPRAARTRATPVTEGTRARSRRPRSDRGPGTTLAAPSLLCPLAPLTPPIGPRSDSPGGPPRAPPPRGRSRPASPPQAGRIADRLRT
ncbi:hypothetical protein CDD83_7628 [Cordyceps sp. RAO-2017]|nr:hypothetical protein CDD83_7628 [Cordyceps sp. RAO-2017]